jgi:DNA topoisomerase-1
VFRTYNASHTFQLELNKETKEAKTITEKMIAYNKANRQVAIMCNHQRSVSKAHDNQINRIDDKVRALKYQREKCKKALLDLEPKLAKKEPELFEPESDMEDEWVIEYEEQLMDRERLKVEKKFEKDNEKLLEEGKKPKPDEHLKQLLKDVDKKQKELEKERKSGVVKAKKGQTSEKLRTQIEKLTERITATNLLKQDKEDNKTTALGTSKINYLDPRISIAWCKKHDVPIAKIFNKSLREKFRWALDVEADWEF